MRRLALVGLAGLLAASPVIAEVVVSDDGRQIELRDDGTWVQVSRDRYATTVDGTRVKLRPDGTWSVVRIEQGEAVPGTGQVTPAPGDKHAVRVTDEPTLLLSEAAILRRTIERAKSRHAQNRMEFTLQLRNDTQAELMLGELAPQGFTVADSRGGTYAVLDVGAPAARAPLAPGEQLSITLLADDAPQWFGIKYLAVTVGAGVLGNARARELRIDMREVKRRKMPQQ